MRWLKHLTSTRDDEKIALLIDRAGHEGYGLWWMVLETVGRSMRPGCARCSVRYPISRWAAELQVAPQNVSRKLAALCAAGLLEMSSDDTGIELCIPNLLKYRDEYTSRIGTKSGECAEQDRDREGDRETDTEREIENPENGAQKERASPLEIFTYWNEHCGRLAAARALTKDRETKCRVRLNSNPAWKQNFFDATVKAAATPFLLGSNDRGWRANFDWMIQNDSNVLKVLEGKYDGNGLKPNSKTATNQLSLEQALAIGAQRDRNQVNGAGRSGQ